jgi:hypothetical protein
VYFVLVIFNLKVTAAICDITLICTTKQADCIQTKEITGADESEFFGFVTLV